MQYRCRVGTATGEVIEATYVADSEARLRTELEEKGMHLLRVDRLDGFAGLHVAGLALKTRPSRRRGKTEHGHDHGPGRTKGGLPDAGPAAGTARRDQPAHVSLDD